jgi:hypothetical protein
MLTVDCQLSTDLDGPFLHSDESEMTAVPITYGGIEPHTFVANDEL